MVYLFIAIIFFALLLIVMEMKEIIDRQKILEKSVNCRLTDFTIRARKILNHCEDTLQHCEDTLQHSKDTVAICTQVETHMLEFVKDLERMCGIEEDNNE